MSLMSRNPGSRSQFLASQHSPHAARYPSPELGVTTKALESRSRIVAVDRPTLVNRPRSLGDLSQVSLTSSTVDLGKQYKSWAKIRVEEATLRTEFNASELRWRRAKQTYLRTRKQYEKAIDPSKTSVDPSSNTLATLRELFELDRAYLETQAVEVTRRRKTLEEAQRNLQNNETLFMEAARRTMQPDPFRALSPMVISPEVPMMPHNGNGRWEPQLDDRLTKLYEKEAQANIFGERLADLEYDYNAALDSREYLRDHDEALSTTDEQFEATIERERVKILQDLDEATKEVEEMRAICDAAGLDVEAHRSNVVDHDDIALTDEQLARQEQYQLPFDDPASLMPQAVFEDAEIVAKPPSEHGSDTFVDPLYESQPNDRLNQWFDSLAV